MAESKITRRKAITTSLKASLVAIGASTFPVYPKSHEYHIPLKPSKKLPFRVSLNTSTLMAYELPVVQQIEMVSAAGFDGIELWIRDVMAYLEKGGTTEALKEKLEQGNLVLEDMIGFTAWCSDDGEERKKALVQLRKEMMITSELGGSYIAAPILGLKSLDATKFGEYTQRYLDILELKEETNVIPLLEIWGTGALSKLSDCAQIVIATGHPDATMLLDFYHLYRGGSGWDTLDCLNGHRLPLFHMNDYPASPQRESLTDADRILPGDGICPFDEILPKLYEAGFRGGLSVELFNKHYWDTMDAETMLRNSYEKTVAVVEHALADKLR